jgi:ABC-type glycerol-3-phosphate transport system permease component
LLILVSLGSIIFFFPFFWMVSTSRKSAHEVIQFPPVWIPAQLRWVNSLKPLIIPVYFADPFFILLLRQYFMTISPHQRLAEFHRRDTCSL